MRHLVLRWVLAGVLLLVLIAALGTALVPEGVLFRTRTPHNGVAPVQLVDRGAADTLAALRGLDACRLVDPAAAAPGRPRDGLGTERTGPHTCRVGAYRADIRVTAGLAFGVQPRWSSAPVVVGGVRGYRSRTIGSRRDCSVAIPVTFELAVGFDVSRIDDVDACGTAEAVAAAAVPRLRTPPPRPDPGDAPLADVDPCAVLAAAGPLDPAVTRVDNDAVALGAAIDGCAAGGQNGSLDLGVVYGEPGDDGCVRSYRVPGARTEDDDAVFLRVSGPDRDCGTVAALTRRLPAALAAVRPVPPASRPVRLFGPDDPDVAATGPCADLPFDCREPEDVDLPSGTDAILAASGTDTSYTCRLAEDPVRRVFGPTLRPTVYGDFCHFVDGRHEIDVAVAASGSWNLRDHPGRDGVVAGHAVRYREDTRPNGRSYGWTVDPGLPGVITVGITRSPPRGEVVGPDPLPSDPATVRDGEALVADLLTTSFG